LVKIPCHVRLLLLSCVLVAAAPPMHAQTKMFKCIIDGRTVYQQTGCPVSARADDVKPVAGVTSASQPASGASAPRTPRAMPAKASAPAST
jgi:hypothetical protein